MAETKKVIEIKKRKLGEELRKEKPNRVVVKRLKDSINRHMRWEKKKKQRKKNRKKWEN